MRGFYPLDTAAEKAPPGSVKLLLAHGAPLGPDSRAMNAAAMSDVPGRMPVMAFLLEMVAWLLEQGLDLEVRNEVGETPAEWAKGFEKDGPERTLRTRRAIDRKNRVKKEEESEENAKKVQEGGGQAA